MLTRKLWIAAVLLGLINPLAAYASQHAKSNRSDKATHAKAAASVAKPNKKTKDKHLTNAIATSKSSKTHLGSSKSGLMKSGSSKKVLPTKTSKSRLSSAKSHSSTQLKRHANVADGTGASEALSQNVTNQTNAQAVTSSPVAPPKLPVSNVAAEALASTSVPEATPSTASALAPISVAQPVSTTQTNEPDGSWSSSVQEVLIKAISLTGIKYRFGGISPDTGFDCSGFVRYVFMQALNLNLPHGARAISQLGQSVAVSDLKPGDLVFFNTLKSTFSHVGIYVGNNRFIHSPSAGGGVSIVDMNDEYWSKRFNGARRIQSPQASNP